LRPGGSINIRLNTVDTTPRFGAPLPPAFPAGTAVLAKYSESSRTWKRATVVKSAGSIRTVRFDGFQDTVDLPVARLKAATGRPEANSQKGAGKRVRQQPERAPLPPATLLPKAASPSEQALCTVRSCLSKLAPDNLDRLTEKVLAVDIDCAATLSAIVDLVFERAIGETAFTEIYARLFVKCAERMPSFDEGSVTFRKLLLNKTQLEFEGQGVERKRKLGATLFVGQLWRQGLLRDQIVHGCVVDCFKAAEEDGEGTLQMDAVEAACTLLRVIGPACDESAAGAARTDAYMARLAAWAADKTKLPAARLRFKVMDVVDARKKGWSVQTM